VCLSEWRKMGYRIALWRDPEDAPIPCDMMLIGPYPGYHIAVNSLCREVMKHDMGASWLVTAGDDMTPDPSRRADEIAAECTTYFSGTFGVMQPTGDKWAASHPERICGSPWMGREFCRRMYGGHGPFCEEYFQLWGDEEMHEVCVKLGILWNREDLVHFHDHFQRGGKRPLSERPSWMVRNDECYQKLKPIFDRRKRTGWPGHEPLPI